MYGRDGRFLLERTSSGALVQYVHLGNRLLARAAGGAVTYQHTDHVGSVVRKTNAIGGEVDSTIYAPYGSVQAGVLSQGPAFTGHVTDQVSGLSYMQQRYHDPLAMRFISVDPVLPSTTDGGNFNRYWYANNNPYKFVDPDGREAGFIYETDGGMRHFYTDNPAGSVGMALGIGIAVASVTIDLVLGGPSGEGVAINQTLRAAAGIDDAARLTEGQARNLARFERKFSNENRNVQVAQARDGSVTMRNEVAGKVPGSKAVYEKTVDAAGNTTSAIKTTYDPKGLVVHVKDKMTK